MRMTAEFLFLMCIRSQDLKSNAIVITILGMSMTAYVGASLTVGASSTEKIRRHKKNGKE